MKSKCYNQFNFEFEWFVTNLMCLINFLLFFQNNITPLHVASKWGRVNMVNTLLDRGARIDAKTRVSVIRTASVYQSFNN